MNLAEFSRENLARCTSPSGFNHPLEMWSEADWLCALVGEIGEAANVVKKLNRIRDGIINKETADELKAALSDELADVFCYLDLSIQAGGALLGDMLHSLDLDREFSSGAMVYYAIIGRENADASEFVRSLAMWAGNLCDRNQDIFSTEQSARAIVHALAALAVFYEIDLSAAIRTKFDKVSAKIGYVAEAPAP
jgi:NTP pyrophosphatase (non-canonical NTP hydrolase)